PGCRFQYHPTAPSRLRQWRQSRCRASEGSGCLLARRYWRRQAFGSGHLTLHALCKAGHCASLRRNGPYRPHRVTWGCFGLGVADDFGYERASDIPPHLRFIKVQACEPTHHDHARHIPLEPPGDADLNGNSGMLCHHSSPSAESTMIRSPIRSRPSEVTSSPLGPNAKVSMPPSVPISTSTPDWMGSSSPDSRSAMICLSAVTPSRQPSCRSPTTLGPLTAVPPRTPAAAPNGLQRSHHQPSRSMPSFASLPAIPCRWPFHDCAQVALATDSCSSEHAQQDYQCPGQ